MRKLFTAILLLCGLGLFAQTKAPGLKTTCRVHKKDGTSFAVEIYADTLWVPSRVWNTAGAIIRTTKPNKFWQRNTTATKWIALPRNSKLLH